MQTPSITQFIPILQTAIGPTIVISGIGLLLLTMTNRLGRAIDRSRILSREIADTTTNATRRAKTEAQLRILWKRARLIRLSITLASISALTAAILIIVLFFTALWQVENAWLIGGLFIVCMTCLIGSLIAFINDINQSLSALRLELARDETAHD